MLASTDIEKFEIELVPKYIEHLCEAMVVLLKGKVILGLRRYQAVKSIFTCNSNTVSATFELSIEC
jgi:hypothetical protein